jgi:hypothetical protein
MTKSNMKSLNNKPVREDFKLQSYKYDIINSILNIIDTSNLLKCIDHPKGQCRAFNPKYKLCAKCKLEKVREQINNLRFKDFTNL